MVGFYARADSTQPVRTDLDNELIDARWFTRQEVLAALNRTSSCESLFGLPSRTAIAGVLIRDWAEGRISFDETEQARRGMKIVEIH